MMAGASQHQIREVTRVRKRQLVAQLQQAQRMQLHVTLGGPPPVISARSSNTDPLTLAAKTDRVVLQSALVVQLTDYDSTP